MTNIYKYITHGALVVASIGAALTLSEAAKAATFTVQQVTDPTFSFTVGDKKFSNFNITGTTVDPDDQVSISFVVGVYQVNYSATAGANPALTTGGTLSYNIDILPGYSNVFATARTDAQGAATPYTKTLSATGLVPATLTFTSGNPTPEGVFDPGIKTIAVNDTWTVGTNAAINGFSDQFRQNPLQPDPVPVPESSAVLGLVALGLVGVVRQAASKSVGK